MRRHISFKPHLFVVNKNLAGDFPLKYWWLKKKGCLFHGLSNNSHIPSYTPYTLPGSIPYMLSNFHPQQTTRGPTFLINPWSKQQQSHGITWNSQRWLDSKPNLGIQKVVGPRDPKLVTLLTMVGKKIVPDKEGVGILAPLRFLWLLGPGWFQPEKYARSSNLDHETRVIDRVKKKSIWRSTSKWLFTWKALFLTLYWTMT